MNKWTLKSLVAAAVGVMAVAGQAHAAISYTYTTDLGPNGVVNLQPGASQTLKLYLRETLTAGSTSLLGTAAAPGAGDGLFSGSVRITRSTGTSASLGAITISPDFTGPNNTATTAIEAKLTEAIGTNDAHGIYLGNSGGVPANARTDSIYLGTVVVTAGATPGSSVFTTLRYDPTRLGNTASNAPNFYDFDVDTSASPAYTGTSNAANVTAESFTVNVVPEPSLAGVGLVMGAAAMIRRRRQQA
jgi:hypothetical protein